MRESKYVADVNSLSLEQQGPILYVVHCVDTEGPLDESLQATFERLKEMYDIHLEPTPENLRRLQTGEHLTGNTSVDHQIQLTFAPDLLRYNRDWSDIDAMTSDLFSKEYRGTLKDDFGGDWKITWFCMDHLDYETNPRKKALGHGVIHEYYRELIDKHDHINDEIQFHYHPKSIARNPLAAATCYANTMPEILEVMARRVIDYQWFPTAYRPGFHAERADCHLFLEQWIPFDFGNQAYEHEVDQPDMTHGRFGNWQSAPKSWCGYHPAIHSYQEVGGCRRKIFRCLNVGTRLRVLRQHHVNEAFEEAVADGSALLAFADHDFRDIRNDIAQVNELLNIGRQEFPNVRVMYCNAEEAARRFTDSTNPELQLEVHLADNVLSVFTKSGMVFGSQPFLALKDKHGKYHHDNLDEIDIGSSWNYVFDEQTISTDALESIGIGAAGRWGGAAVKVINPSRS